MRCVVLDTSSTNFFAFVLGSLSLFPAVEYFCYYAAVAIMFDFMLQVTQLALRMYSVRCDDHQSLLLVRVARMKPSDTPLFLRYVRSLYSKTNVRQYHWNHVARRAPYVASFHSFGHRHFTVYRLADDRIRGICNHGRQSPKGWQDGLVLLLHQRSVSRRGDQRISHVPSRRPKGVTKETIFVISQVSSPVGNEHVPSKTTGLHVVTKWHPSALTWIQYGFKLESQVLPIWTREFDLQNQGTHI